MKSIKLNSDSTITSTAGVAISIIITRTIITPLG